MPDQSSDSTKEKTTRPDPIDISRIMFQSGQNSPRKPPPTERISSSPTTRTSMESVQTSTSTISHSRSSSTADHVHARQNKRLSLTGFPVQQPNSRSSRPASWIMSPTKPPEDVPASPEAGFLTVLASQERRVLELKDELRQAELELDRLKAHYSDHEARKKPIDTRKSTQLQPLSASLSTLETAEEDEDGSSEWVQKEMERRKTLLKGTRTSNRKVFSGSRHTRTLSLLSPEKSSFSQPFSPPEPEARRSDSISSRPPPLTRSSTTSDVCESPMRPADLPQMDGTQTKDALVRTGKQMAADLKDGLMTFFEDIRQATVGDEGGTIRAAQGQGQGRQPSRTTRGGRPGQLNRAASARTASNKNTNNDVLIDIGGAFWHEHGMGVDSSKHKANTRTASKTMNAKREATPVKTEDDDWDNWDTPIKLANSPSPSDGESTSSSQFGTRSTPLTSAGGHDPPAPSDDRTLTPRRVTTPSSAAKRDSISWPNLDKIPSNLKRTASHLMKEWEKTMSPLSPSFERVGGIVEHDSDSGLDYPSPSPREGSRSHSTSPALGGDGRVKVKKAD
ncbi:hypothetical protein E2P81_ATG02201 [Venturia nashicola]|uniref:DUF4048 domain-containing protein n=1 Tax=Venturia nashicola TaxID=86259 RepID=A0A4Z1PLY3_9PEZI|nr:hypothetical protein E6O75_ATG02258 [Venturia nashicola]TLD35898.1 hypothetical protein E2P81_ATG02201 [Venturia nashicola]